VEQAPGFLWLEVCVDSADPAAFYLISRWTDLASFDRWDHSEEHRTSHRFIPKGLKLDPTSTRVHRLIRIDGTTGSPLLEAVADATPLFGAYTAGSTELHVFVLDRDGVIRTCNPAACTHLEPGGVLDGKSLMDYMPEADAARLKELLSAERNSELPVHLNFGAPNRVPFTLGCWLDVQPDRVTVLGQPTFRRDQQMQNELMAINQELAVLSRERSRELRDERSQLPEREMIVFADGHRLHQVFSNVIGNAFKYTPPGGTITLTASIEGERAVVSVADEGEGIVPERLPHIFDLFQRATTTGSELGVGLAVVKALVTAHDGTVAAVSEGLGRGTVFTIRLPLTITT
jgi:hypothetical protein